MALFVLGYLVGHITNLLATAISILPRPIKTAPAMLSPYTRWTAQRLKHAITSQFTHGECNILI